MDLKNGPKMERRIPLRQTARGKVIGNTVDLCSGISENYSSLDDYLQEYADGLMTAGAKAICEALLEHGPLDTIRLCDGRRA